MWGFTVETGSWSMRVTQSSTAASTRRTGRDISMILRACTENMCLEIIKLDNFWNKAVYFANKLDKHSLIFWNKAV